MLKAKPTEFNTENLRLVSARLASIPHFIFFGTLLGYVREKSIIVGDDDIDVYVDRRFKADVIEALSGSDIKFRNRRALFRTEYFAQGVREIQGEKTFIDFYFYEDNENLDYIIENWNFNGEYENESNALHIPKSIIFPLNTGRMQGFDVSIPTDAEACCQYLYGENWRIPIAKSTEYRTEIINNRPQIIRV